MDTRKPTRPEADELIGKIARWGRARERGLAIRVAVRATDLTVDLLEMDEERAWDVLISRAYAAVQRLEAEYHAMVHEDHVAHFPLHVMGSPAR